MQFRLLGPVEAATGERLVPLGALKQRHLLAALLFDGGRPVTFETLIDRLWDDAPPADARGTLYGYVARLRRSLRDLPGVRLDRWPGGYTLSVPERSVDLFRFRELAEQGRTGDSDATRAAAFDAALGLWHGPALGGLPGSWAAHARQGLEWHRSAALAGWAQATLAQTTPAPAAPTQPAPAQAAPAQAAPAPTALARITLAQDRAGDVIDRLTAALPGDPLSEPLIALLMRALHAAGRTPEALDLFATTRARIAEQLGTDPGRLLQAAHADLLGARAGTGPHRDDGAPAEALPPRHVPADHVHPPELLPPDLPDHTGHEEQIAAVREALRRPDPVVVITGPGGAGKTTLAVHIGHLMRDAYPDGRLFLNVGGADPLAPPEALSRALRALGLTDSDAQGNPDLRERVARYRAALTGKRLLVIVDDAASARQVLPFLPGPGSALLVTSRSRLTTVPAVARVEVGEMSPAEAHTLLVRIIGSARADADPGADRPPGRSLRPAAARCSRGRRPPRRPSTLDCRAAGRPAR